MLNKIFWLAGEVAKLPFRVILFDAPADPPRTYNDIRPQEPTQMLDLYVVDGNEVCHSTTRVSPMFTLQLENGVPDTWQRLLTEMEEIKRARV